MLCIEQLCRVVASLYDVPKKIPSLVQAPHATHPADELGTHCVTVVDPNDASRWLALADTALRVGATEVAVVEAEALARREQATIKKRIHRTAEKVKRQSKSTQ